MIYANAYTTFSSFCQLQVQFRVFLLPAKRLDFSDDTVASPHVFYSKTCKIIEGTITKRLYMQCGRNFYEISEKYRKNL